MFLLFGHVYDDGVGIKLISDAVLREFDRDHIVLHVDLQRIRID